VEEQNKVKKKVMAPADNQTVVIELKLSKKRRKVMKMGQKNSVLLMQ
jgi:hypothetical protein